MSRHLTIRNTQSPGDIIVLSAMIRDLHRTYPGRYETSVSVSKGSEDAYVNSPYVDTICGHTGRQDWFVAHYPLIHKSNQQRKHFLRGFIEDANKRLQLQIRLSEFKPDLHLAPSEMAEPPIEPPYWVFLSGGKRDFTAKIWDQVYWQQVIDATRDRIRWVQCGGGSSNHIQHMPKQGIYADLIGQTTLRKFMRLIYHADGVVCVVTAAMHIAAAFNKPCVVIAGGREPWWWEAYNEENRLVNMRYDEPSWKPSAGDGFVPHKFLHTIGQLDCCKNGGCWKGKIHPRDANGRAPGGGSCRRPVKQHGAVIPECLAMIKPEHVIDSIFEYYREGLILGRKTISLPEPQTVGCYAFDGHAAEGWLTALAKQLPARPVVFDGAMPRYQAILSAAADGKDWIVWFEPGNEPSADWRRLTGNLALPAVFGRIHRTRDGKLYPYPGAFIAHRSLLNPKAHTYVDLFSEVPPNRFRSEPSILYSMRPEEVS